jgi:predicted DCC family thiol-disulfide oxidoreductase YuxK
VSGKDDQGLQIAYDGECPFCSAYVRVLRLRESIGKVELINARSDHPFIRDVRDRGFDLDEGFVARMGGRYYHGAECLHLLSMLSSPYGFWNRLMAFFFRHEWLARFMYPVLRAGRNTALFMLGKSRIG